MAFQLDLDYAAELAPHEFERCASFIDPAWIDEALQQTGTLSLRRRRLPAERMVWLVIGLALFRNEPIWHIVQQLDLADGPVAKTLVPSAAVAGLERLGGQWVGCSTAFRPAGVSKPYQAKDCFMDRAATLSMA